MSYMRINYNQVIRQANKMESDAEDLGREIQRLEALKNAIVVDWDGPASRTFRTKIDQLIENITHTQRDMSRISTAVKNAADKIKREDERQAELAEQLKNKN